MLYMYLHACLHGLFEVKMAICTYLKVYAQIF